MPDTTPPADSGQTEPTWTRQLGRTTGDAAYIRRYYQVPAQRGMQIVYTGGSKAQPGVIVGFSGAHLRIRLDGERGDGSYHPTWRIEYLASPARPDGARGKVRSS